MKKIISLLMVSLLCIGTLQAQLVPKGSKILSTQLTNLGFNSVSYKIGDSDESIKMNRIGLSLLGGYAILDNVVILGSFALQSLKLDENKLSAVTLGGTARKYFDNGFFAGAGLNLLNGKIVEESTTLIDGLLHAGFSHEIFPKLTIEPMVTFSTKLAGGNLEGYDHKLKYTQISINIGFSYYF